MNFQTASDCSDVVVILGLHSRHVLAWAVSNRIKNDFAIRVLNMAVRMRQPPEGCLSHPDGDSYYCSYDYPKKLQAYSLRPSISGKGDCDGNSAVEAAFKTLKAEMI